MLRTAALTGLLLMLLPMVSAQVSPSYAIQLDVEDAPDSLPAGGKSDFTMTVSRVCAMQANVLPAETIRLEIHHAGEIQVGGSRSIAFPQFVCAPDGIQEVTDEYSVAIDQHAEVNRTFSIQVEAYASSYQPPMQPAEPAFQDLLLSVAPPPAPGEAAVAQDEAQPEKEAPAPAAALLVMALLLMAVAIRRRQS